MLSIWLGSHTISHSGCCGRFGRSQSAASSEVASRRRFRRKKAVRVFNPKKDWWSSSPEVMENRTNVCSMQTEASIGSTSQAEEAQSPNANINKDGFVNHALILWNERRREWRGNHSETRSQMARDCGISWNATYDDLLVTNHPFPQPIPLPEMIDFLVDVWHEEGLYDNIRRV